MEYVSYDDFALLPAEGRIVYRYSFNDELHFETAIQMDLTGAEEAQLAGTAFALGMVLLSYVYVAFCPPLIRVRAGALDEAALRFWENLYHEGLLEHFYVHQIPVTPIQIISEGKRTFTRVAARHFAHPQVLCLLGCGKDSALLFELIKAQLPLKQGSKIGWLYFEEYPGEFDASWRYPAMAVVSGVPEVTRIAHQFTLPQLLEPHKRYANITDYVLYSTLYAFTSVLVSIRQGYDYIAIGNERSANFGNVMYAHRLVNHQYEKSFAYEQALHTYIKTALVEDLYFFSGLMCWWELQIVERFAQLSQYVPVFMSCNQPNGEQWCGRCPKCVMAFALLSAFLAPATVWSVFNANFFDDASLYPVFEELMGLRGVKPLECVSTPEEMLAALYLAQKRTAAAPSPFFQHYAEAVARGEQYLYLLDDFNPEHLFPSWYTPFVPLNQ